MIMGLYINFRGSIEYSMWAMSEFDLGQILANIWTAPYGTWLASAAEGDNGFDTVWLLRSAVGMTHSLRSDLWWTIPFHVLLDHFGIPIGYSEIDQTYLSIEAQCVSHYYPRWTATLAFHLILVWVALALRLGARDDHYQLVRNHMDHKISRGLEYRKINRCRSQSVFLISTILRGILDKREVYYWVARNASPCISYIDSLLY